ncbi:hypothetical protein Vi05172_g2019 [Venturia inaequalis]|uniref:Uncharacterized protein n=2 Tax=Venturia inaequalis TaxID=5025 RepID=A0A8H3VS86_VENIN|nr:hypothetical protein EG327_006473 [Venturia inaequalis]RDI88325.1 hypothetical protein Vi05172_g2019 [Venturia inaequalis]
MSPNPFTALKLLVKPHKWMSHRPGNRTPKSEPEHWEKSTMVAIPGHYQHRPGRGWYLTAVDNAEDCTLRLPQKVIYSSILHRWMLVCDFEKRRRQEIIKHPSYYNGQPKLRGFFLMDDEKTYVMAWNSTGEFILHEGSVQGWCIDETTRILRPMARKDRPKSTTKLIDGIPVEGSSSRAPSVQWVESRNASVAGPGHVCASCNVSSPASVFDRTESKNGTALTTPGSPAPYGTEDDEVNAKELRVKLKELYDNQPKVIRA